MTENTPEEKLLNIIRKDQHRSRFKKDMKVFTKINIILIGAILIITVFFLLDTFIFNNKISELPSVDTGSGVGKIEPISDDSEAVPPGINIDINVEAAKEASVKEIKANLNILGIITGDNNQAIIEDKGLKKTFFLYKGDSVGEAKVVDIENNTVILDYKGEKIELRI